MKITVGVLFGGRSVENEISVVTASQVIESMDKDKYEIVPIYIAKSGKWYTGSALLDLKRYRDMPSLLKECISNPSTATGICIRIPDFSIRRRLWLR